MPTIEDRLAVLERSVVRYRFGFAVIGLGCIALVVTAAAWQEDAGAKPKVADVIRTRRLEIVNKDDRSVIVLSFDDRGEGMVLVGNGGQPRTVLSDKGCVVSDGGFIAAMGPAGKPATVLGVNAAGHGYLQVWAKDGHTTVEAGADNEGKGHFAIMGGDGTPRIAAGVSAEDAGLLALKPKEGDAGVLAGVHTDGGFVITTNNKGEAMGIDSGSPSGTPLSLPKSTTRVGTDDPTPKSKDRARWRQLKKGMTAEGVRATLGEPERVDSLSGETWWYAPGMVKFDTAGRVTMWSEP